MKQAKDFIREESKMVLYKSLSDYLGTQFFPSESFLESDFSLGNNDDYIQSSYQKIPQEDHVINLYIHIPFCKTKCYYCHCYKHLSKSDDEHAYYVSFLEKEMKLIADMMGGKKLKLNSIFIGGGTPNIIGNTNLKRLLSSINTYFDVSDVKQYNIDLNPYNVDLEQIKILKEAGVDRCTYAIQTFDESVLEQNTRFFVKDFDHEYYIAQLKEHGIETNIDIMFGIKGQKLKSSIEDIHKAIELNAHNVSLNYFIQSANVHYTIDKENLELIYKIKKYYNEYVLGELNTSYNMQEDTYMKSKVNLIGIGNGAISHLFGKLTYYNNDLKYYYDTLEEGKIPAMKGLRLTQRDEMIKYIWFNSMYGIGLKEFQNFFGVDLYDEFPDEVDFLVSEGIFILKNDVFSPLISNVKFFLYLTVFLKKYVHNLEYNQEDLIGLDMKLVRFFLKSGEKVDEDY